MSSASVPSSASAGSVSKLSASPSSGGPTLNLNGLPVMRPNNRIKMILSIIHSAHFASRK